MNKIKQFYYICKLIKNLLAPVLNLCSSEHSTTSPGSSFHDLVYAGIKLLEYWTVLHLTREKERLCELATFLVIRTGWNKLGRFECRGCRGLWKILKSIHKLPIERRCHKLILRSGIKNLQEFRFLSSSLRWESAAEAQTGEQYSKHGRINE